MALQYTKQQGRAINDAWYAIKRAVETDHQQEKRVEAAERVLRKHFGHLAARSHIVGYVAHGMREPGPATLDNLAHQSDENILCYMVGRWIEGKERDTPALREFVNLAREAEADACQQSLESL